MPQKRNTRRDPNIAAIIGGVLKEIRLFRNLTQSECAEKMNITQSQWSAFETGLTRLDFVGLTTVSKLFEIDIIVLCYMIDDRIKFKNLNICLSLPEYQEIVKKNEEQLKKIRQKKARNEIVKLESYLK